MTKPDVEADWLQDTLADVARRLRRPGIGAAQLAECAAILERIVGDLRGTPWTETLPTPVKPTAARWWIIIGGGFALYLLMRRVFCSNRDN